MAKVIMAAFDNSEHATMAVDELESLGYGAKDISVISKVDNRVQVEGNESNPVVEGTVSGASTGGVLGGLAGLLAGAGVFPALAGLLIGGPIAAALGATGVVATTVSGAVTGAVAGGLIGALTGLGIPEEDARYYNTTVEQGGVVVGVPVMNDNDVEVRETLESHGANQLRTVEMGS